MSNLKGKTAIVTGSSRGIGRAIALRLAQDGANVVVTYHSSKDTAEEVVNEIKNKGVDAMPTASSAIALQVNVREIESVRDMFSKAIEHFGKIDILVNNAAGKNIFKPNVQMTPEEYDSMFDITRGVYFTLQEAAKQLADGGRIVSISTGGTSMATPGGGAYAGSKAAVEQFSNSLAKELGDRQITVNTIAPGVTDTDGLVLEQEQVDELISQTPLGRLGQPNDIANAIAMLVSDDAGWITGQNIRATGGIV